MCFHFQPTISQQTDTDIYFQDWSHRVNSTMVPVSPKAGHIFSAATSLLRDVDIEKPVLKHKRLPNLLQKWSRSSSRSKMVKVSQSNQHVLYNLPVGVRIFFIYFLKVFIWGAKKSLQKDESNVNGVIRRSYLGTKVKEA